MIKWVRCNKVNFVSARKMAKMFGGDEDDYCPSNTFEISVVHEDNSHGKNSYGWGGESKIILFSSDDYGTDSMVESDLEPMLEKARLICQALNNYEYDRR